MQDRARVMLPSLINILLYIYVYCCGAMHGGTTDDQSTSHIPANRKHAYDAIPIPVALCYGFPLNTWLHNIHVAEQCVRELVNCRYAIELAVTFDCYIRICSLSRDAVRQILPSSSQPALLQLVLFMETFFIHVPAGFISRRAAV